LELVRSGTAGTIEEIADWIRPLPGDWWIAIDAPLVVHNRSGRRASDAAISRLYQRFDAGAHPTNLTILRDRVRGGELVQALSANGVRIVDALPRAGARGRWAFEAYPHAGMVELFGLDRIVKYKHGRVAERRAGQDELASLLQTRLPQLDPPLTLNKALRRLLGRPDPALRGGALKAREDELDAVFCAYLAAHLWAWGRSRQRLLGDPSDGAVVLPAVRTDI
jgi:predicted RNase H-like nuclease